ncbi:MAG: DNA primase [Candidatus Colwellbacteria bacterium RIFCSPLOWO2_12_FULL_46_17]|uniref:DNA primase n=2 Tax=Candidatus Colwelliibacteriota TaxID=1817904 RepID=A0A1G1ZDB9_9BACT|nr:MAG: DNA primase [Candidatus Colwellbacteria bacterium RIFCSPLOWO2_02_FULL_45_11]OGY62544.1 MAG: DNA primase [Candidatus Colwellbacteria bacterium RIFCSPLOWO2_12_FULL_46_17]
MARPSEEIKDRLDLVEFIKGYIEVRPAGKNFKALCPFHNEKTPSFVISPERQIWHCFGCGEGGDVFKFLMRYENLEFYEALRVLAERAGVELRSVSPEDQRQFGILYELNGAAADFFEEALPKSKTAQDYIKRRGLKEETAKEFAVGYAPAEADELTTSLLRKGFAIEDIVRAGLTIKTEKGRYFDRFRGRIMFPIHNHFGKVVGFSGRILPEFDKENVGKYINSPDTPIFNKSRLLYGFWQSKRDISNEDKVLLVEGQMDFLLAWQDGIRNVFATSGTALTGEHLRTLRRITGNIIMGFDKDEAGQLAAERSIDLAGANDFSVRIMSLGEHKDPADAAVNEPGFIKRAMDDAISGMEYYFERYLTPETMKNISKKKLAIRVLLMKIKALWSPVERSHWIHELASESGIKENDLIEELEKLKLVSVEPGHDVIEDEFKKRKLERRDVVVEQILSLAAGDDRFKNEMKSRGDLVPSHYIEVYKIISGVGEVVQDPQVQNLVNLIVLRSGFLFDLIPEEKLQIEFNNLLKELMLEQLREKRASIGAEIAVAEDRGDDKKVLVLLREFDDVLRKMQDIENASQKEEVRS